MGVTHIPTSSPAMRAKKGHESKTRSSLRGLSWPLYVLIVVTVGRVLDIVPGLSSLPLVKVVLAWVAFALIAYRKVLPEVLTPNNPAVKWAMALAVWIAISLSFSIWPGRSVAFIIGPLPVLSAIVFVIGKLSGDWKLLRNSFFALFVAAMSLATLGLLSYGGGRLAVESSYDTNDLAYVLDGVIPIALAFGMTAESRMRRLVSYGAGALMVLSVILTSSRGGMFGLLAVVAFIVLEPGTLRPQQATTAATARRRKTKMGAKTRIVLSLAACGLIGIVAWPFLPPETRERLATMVSLGSDYNVNDEKTGRLEIWQRGLEALAHRPIGVGIDAFPMIDVKYGFHTAHNSLVLVLVELGPLGFVMYLAMLLHVWRGLTKIRRILCQLEAPSEQERHQAIFCRMLQAGLVGNFVAGQFLSATYFYSHWVNLALAMAFIALFNREKLEPNLERKIVFGR